MASVTITTPVFVGTGTVPSSAPLKNGFPFKGRFPVKKVDTPNVACYYKVSTSNSWTKVKVNETFEVPDNKSVQIKCVVPYTTKQNYAPFILNRIFNEDDTVEPVFQPSTPVKIILRDGNVPVKFCNFYRNGKAFSRDFTDYGEDSPRTWEETFSESKPGGFTWKGFKDGDYLLAWDEDESFQVVVSAYGNDYSAVLVDLIPKEESEGIKEVPIMLHQGKAPFIEVTPVQSAQKDSKSKGKTYRSDWVINEDVLYIAPKEDAFALYLETGPARQYDGYTSTLKFECGEINHIDPCKTMTAVGQICNRAMHKFLLPKKGYEGELKIINSEGVSKTIKVVKSL